MERKETYSIKEIREVLKDTLMLRQGTPNSERDVILDGDAIHGNSQRYQVFLTKGTKCACCGIEGQFFAKEKTAGQNRYHLNLYAIDSNGNEVLMTKDHIIPKCLGGRNQLNNYQTLCKTCNEKKAYHIIKY